MSTLTKPRAKKPVRVVRKTAPAAAKAAALRAVDENGRFILGYASHAVSLRPGSDLTKPTLPPGKYIA
jgi:hypothetical protein